MNSEVLIKKMQNATVNLCNQGESQVLGTNYTQSSK